MPCLENKKLGVFIIFDDSLNMDKEMAVCQSNTKMMLHSLESLGYTVNYKKSVLVPTQRIIFFGFILDSVQFNIFLTEEKVQKIKTKAQSLLNTDLVVVREVADRKCISCSVRSSNVLQKFGER